MNRLVDALAHGRSKCGFRWTEESIAYGLNRFHCHHLRTPTLKEIRTGIDDLPSYSTIQRTYGSMGNMLRRHGYRARTPGGQPGRTVMPRRSENGRFMTGPASKADVTQSQVATR
jgi:hypothetical protein